MREGAFGAEAKHLIEIMLIRILAEEFSNPPKQSAPQAV